MSAHIALKEIEMLDENGMRNFLRANGMRACLKIFELEKINGGTFLNLSKDDFLRWRKIIFEPEIKAIEKFLKNVKEHPEKFVKPRCKKPTTPLSRSTFYFDLSSNREQAQFFDDTQASCVRNTTPIFHDIKFAFTPSQSPDLLENRKCPPIPKKPSICRNSKVFTSSPKNLKLTQSIFFGELEKKLEYRKSIMDRNKNNVTLKRQFTTKYHILETVEDNQKRTWSPSDLNGNPEPPPLRSKYPTTPEVRDLDPNNNKELKSVPAETEPSYLQAKKRSHSFADISGSKYYLNYNRDEAEVFLKINAKDGTYLFRPSSRHYCALSILIGNEVHHVAVKSIEGGKLELAIDGNLQFNSLEDIVDYFDSNPIQAATFQKIVRLNSHVIGTK